MFDLSKEVALSHAMGEFFSGLEERLSSYQGYGITNWYLDVAWASRLFVQAEAPYFTGKNAATWTTLADELESRAEFHSSNASFFVPWAVGIEKGKTWGQAGATVLSALQVANSMFQIIGAEEADLNVLPSGDRGVTVGEALKVVRLFTQNFWAEEYKWSRVPSPHKAWLVACRAELLAAQIAMGELQVNPVGTLPTSVPWSSPVTK
jgi:hypothetical protein